MMPTTHRETAHLITVDIDGLTAMLSCGAATAKKIAAEAEARIVIGRRVLYSVQRVKDYINQIAE